MNKTDYAKRIKRLICRERTLTRKDNIAAKLLAQFNESKLHLQQALYEQRKEMMVCQKRIKLMEQKNKKLTKIVQKLNTEVLEAKEKLKRIQETIKKQAEGQLQQRQKALEQMDNFHCLKSASDVYIRFDALPKLVKGFKVYDTGHKSHWQPFCIQSNTQTLRNVRNFIWEKPVDSRWHHLFYEKNKFEYENGNNV